MVTLDQRSGREGRLGEVDNVYQLHHNLLVINELTILK